jgi:hypothetical protein
VDGTDDLDLTQEQIDTYLEHHGVKGQKWGVRRDGSNGGITKFKGKAKTLTDAELNARIKRLETEKRYKELNKKQVSVGMKHVNEVLVHIGKESAKKFGVSAVGVGTKLALNKKFKDHTTLNGLGDQLYPKKK